MNTQNYHPWLQYHTEWFYCPKRYPVIHLPPPSTFKFLEIIDRFKTSIVLPFPDCHIIGITHSAPFLSGSFHAIWCIWINHLFLAKDLIYFWFWIIFHCMHVTQFVHSPFDRYFVYLHFLAVIYKAAIDSRVQDFVDIFFQITWVKS